MKTLKKITLTMFLIGTLVTSVKFVHGQSPLIISNSAGYITNIPYVSAGLDFTMCNSTGYKAQGSTNIDGTIYWISDGNGIFNNPFSLNPLYLPGKEDIIKGQVTLTLHVIPQAVSFPPMQDEVIIYLNKCLNDPSNEQ